MPSQNSSMHSHQSTSPYAIQSIVQNNSIDSTSSNLNRQRQRLEETAALRRSADVFRRFENSQRSSSSSSTTTTSTSTINANQAQLERESERLRERERQRFLRERERDDRLLRDISSRAQVESQQRQHQHHHSSSRTSDQNQPSTSSSSRNQSSGEQQHRVYLLNCKHCDNFLSDRGMKAVLLLKPNITLYSTDSTPANCGPLWTPSRLGPGGGRNPVINGEKPVERTCECLTQTLGCYGCGSSIGYSILSPCSRCTSSVVKHQRSSNGHRTVLHCSEISVRERRYVPGEPGVNAAIPPPPPPSNPLLSSPSNHHHGLGIRYLSSQSQQYNASYPYSSNSSSRSSSPYSSSPNASFNQLDPDGNFYDSPNSSYLDDLEAEKAEAAFHAAQAQAQMMAQQAQAAAAASRSASGTSSSSNGKKSPRIIKRGDPIYWSDLVPGGERAEPFNPDPILAMPVAGR